MKRTVKKERRKVEIIITKQTRFTQNLVWKYRYSELFLLQLIGTNYLIILQIFTYCFGDNITNRQLKIILFLTLHKQYRISCIIYYKILITFKDLFTRISKNKCNNQKQIAFCSCCRHSLGLRRSQKLRLCFRSAWHLFNFWIYFENNV